MHGDSVFLLIFSSVNVNIFITSFPLAPIILVLLWFVVFLMLQGLEFGCNAICRTLEDSVLSGHLRPTTCTFMVLAGYVILPPLLLTPSLHLQSTKKDLLCQGSVPTRPPSLDSHTKGTALVFPVPK